MAAPQQSLRRARSAAARLAARRPRRATGRRAPARLPGHGDARAPARPRSRSRWPRPADRRPGRRPRDRRLPDRPPAHPVGRRRGDALGLPLDAALTNAVGPVRPDLRGYVTTYAQVAAKPALHAARTAAKRIAGRSSTRSTTPGTGCRGATPSATAFELARPPAVPDRHAVPHPPGRAHPVRPLRRRRRRRAGAAAPTSPTATARRCADGVVRPVVFAAYTGTSRWRNSAGEVIAASLSEPSTKQHRGDGLAHRAQPARASGSRTSSPRWTSASPTCARSGMPDAAGLVLASDQDDARAYAEIVEQVTGEAPVVILSDDPKASDKIAAFTDRRRSASRCACGWCPRASTSRAPPAWPG